MAKLPTKDLCRCKTFCLEDTAATGRVCRIEQNRKKSAANTNADLDTQLANVGRVMQEG